MKRREMRKQQRDKFETIGYFLEITNLSFFLSRND